MKVTVVAEIGCNHGGSVAVAKEMILEAKRCGCDYVKFQKRHMGSIPKELAEKPYLGENSFGATYLDHRMALELDGASWRELQGFAKKNDIGFFGTAFDFPSAEFLISVGVPFIKIGSAQSKDFELMKSIANIPGCPPMIISTGMQTHQDVKWLTLAFAMHTLVHTTSSYPCPEDEINLAWLKEALLIKYFSKAFEIGLSGHYAAGNGAIEAAAVALGVTYIERHFTLDRTWKGSDQAASLEPIGMMNVVKAVRQVERAWGSGEKEIMPSEIKVMEKLGLKK